MYASNDSVEIDPPPDATSALNVALLDVTIIAELANDETSKVERANVILNVVDVDIETPWFLLSRPPRVRNITPNMTLSNFKRQK